MRTDRWVKLTGMELTAPYLRCDLSYFSSQSVPSCLRTAAATTLIITVMEGAVPGQGQGSIMSGTRNWPSTLRLMLWNPPFPWLAGASNGKQVLNDNRCEMLRDILVARLDIKSHLPTSSSDSEERKRSTRWVPWYGGVSVRCTIKSRNWKEIKKKKREAKEEKWKVPGRMLFVPACRNPTAPSNLHGELCVTRSLSNAVRWFLYRA